MRETVLPVILLRLVYELNLQRFAGVSREDFNTCSGVTVFVSFAKKLHSHRQTFLPINLLDVGKTSIYKAVGPR